MSGSVAAVAVVVGVLVALSVAGSLAPWELLRLGYGWDRPDPAPEPHPRAVADPRLFLVYLDGIGKLTPRQTPVGLAVATELRRLLPAARILTCTLPYSVLGRPHTEHPRHGRGWLLVRRRATWLLYAHNAVTMFAACDRRYHRRYRDAAAASLLTQLRAAGYPEGSGLPLVLVGYSGGAQVALLAAPELTAALRTPPVTVVSIGGFLDGAVALDGVGVVHHLRSTADAMERLARVLFPARWPLRPRSPWNRGRRDGVVREHRLDPAHHVGRSGYLSDTAALPDGRSHLRRTCELICDLVAARPRGAPALE